MKKIKEAYARSKQAKVGDVCVCPSCNRSFIKEHYQQAFCKSMPGTKCKDRYWNTVDPSKRNNTTRISPASQAWIDKQREKRDNYDYDDDPGWDAHKGYH